MTAHLSPEELVDAVDGALAADRQAHVAVCTPCAAQIAELREALGDARAAGDIPEPSPLFWDVLANRVRAATAAEPIAAPVWRRNWKPAVALTAMAATALLAVLLRTPAPAPIAPPSTAVIGMAEPAPLEEDYAWDLVVTMAANLPHDDVHEVAPASPAAAVMIEELTPRQRDAFVKLIQREMGGLE